MGRNELGRNVLGRRCLVVVAAALLVAGCGSKAHPAGHTSAGRPTTPTTNSSSTDCNTLGINPTGMREGTCTHAGITYVIVDENHMLRLRTLSARLSAVRTAIAMVGGSQPATAHGRFVIASILITNRLELRQGFDAGGTRQAGLILDGTVYPEDVGAERTSDPSSCQAAKVSIAAGRSVVCQVVFDVPSASAADLGKHGRADLYLVDFGADLGGSVLPQLIGQIRLYR